MTSLSPSRPLPALRLADRTARRADGLTPAQRRVGVGVIAGLHVVGLWALLQVGAVREAARDAAPMFFDLIAPVTPPAPKPPEPVPPPKAPVPAKRPPPPAPRLVTAAPSPATSPVVAPAPVPAPPAPPLPAEPAPAAEVVATAAPLPPAAPAPVPRTIPPSAVQYLVEPAPEYPRASIRNHETGRVIVRLFISEAGVPSQASVERSSGFARLDDAAVVAVLKSRFKPPTEGGRPVSGWTLSPIDFSLEK